LIRPSPSELLSSIAETLRESVSVSLPRGEARNQVRAAAAILRRLSSVWDRIVPVIQEENRDIEATLRSLAEWLPELPLIMREDSPDSGSFDHAAAHNLRLQERLAEIHDALNSLQDEEVKVRIEVALRALYLRNLARDREQSGRG
jgi:BMFP domain-containing protein YqiC